MNILLCENKKALVDNIVKYVREAHGKHECVLGAVDFCVAEVPTKKEWDKFTKKDKESAWDDATGCYGIRDAGTMFDCFDFFMLVGCYYGGNCLASTEAICWGSSDRVVSKHVAKLVDYLLSFDDVPNGPYLLRLDPTGKDD